MNIDENIEKLERRIEHNANKIEYNAKSIEKNSYALNILKDYKEDSRRLFVILLIVLFMWIVTGGYLVYLLNDIGTIKETEKISQESESGNNNYIGNDGDITNG